MLQGWPGGWPPYLVLCCLNGWHSLALFVLSSTRVDCSDIAVQVQQYMCLCSGTRLTPDCVCLLQFVDEERLEELKTSVGLLKKLQRQKAVAELKAYRKEMEVRPGT